MNDMKNKKEANAAASQKRAHEIDHMTLLMKKRKNWRLQLFTSIKKPMLCTRKLRRNATTIF